MLPLCLTLRAECPEGVVFVVRHRNGAVQPTSCVISPSVKI